MDNTFERVGDADNSLKAKRFDGIFSTLESADKLMGILLSNGADQRAKDAVVFAAFEVIVEIAEGRHDNFLAEENNE